MLVNQGEEAFGEGEKAKKTVKATKAIMRAYAKATVFLVLRRDERVLRSVERLAPPIGMYLVASAMEIGGLCLSPYFFLWKKMKW